jgi:hypothetical protein
MVQQSQPDYPRWIKKVVYLFCIGGFEMIRLFRVGLLVLIIFPVSAVTTWAKPTVAVMDFENKTPYGG